MNWAKQRAEEVYDKFMDSAGKTGNLRAETLRGLIAAELQRVADDCTEVLWERSSDEQYGHAKAAVMLDIEAIEAKFPKENV